MSWEKVATLGVAGAIVVAVLWITGSPQAVPVVIGALLMLLAGLRSESGPRAGNVTTTVCEDREALSPETSG